MDVRVMEGVPTRDLEAMMKSGRLREGPVYD